MMRTTALWTLAILTLSGCAGSVTSSETNPPVSLFNGRDLTGWTFVCQDAARTADQTWTVQDPVLHCAGRPAGYLRTDQTYRNYHLHLEWRWPDTPTNSGLLVHGQGPDQIWPLCLQCQLKKDQTGDFIVLNGAGMTVNGKSVQAPQGGSEVIKRQGEFSEKAPGQWNAYDVYCRGDHIRSLVNGVLQGEGSACVPASGWIGLQGEAGPIEFRNITIESLE